MTALPLAELAQAQLDAVFELAGDAVVVGDYHRAEGGLVKQDASFLLSTLRPAECDGSVLMAGDEKLILRVSDLAVYAFSVLAGDYISTELEDGTVTFYVVRGVVDPLWVYWTFYCRRTPVVV